jgi:hypothetical protein
MHRSVWKLGSLFSRMCFLFLCATAFVNMILKRKVLTSTAKVQSVTCDSTADEAGEVSVSVK